MTGQSAVRGEPEMFLTLKGKVFTELNEGRRFMELPWVGNHIRKKLRFDLYRGTLNLFLSSGARISDLLRRSGCHKIPWRVSHLSGPFSRALANDRVLSAVVRPDVKGFMKNVLELTAPVCLRKKLCLEDCD